MVESRKKRKLLPAFYAKITLELVVANFSNNYAYDSKVKEICSSFALKKTLFKDGFRS